MNFLTQIQSRTVCAVLMAAGIIFLNGLVCHAAGTVEFSNNRLTLVAENEPFIPLLEEIAKKTNVVIFVSKGLNPGNVNILMNDLPLEKAFNRLLKGYNVAMVYYKDQDNTRVSAVKIYPKGEFSGPLNVMVQASVPEAEPDADTPTRYEKDATDILGPGEYVRTVEYDVLTVNALEFEKTETDAWKEIQTLKDRINDEMDETKNMHRVEHFNESKANKDKQQQQD
jgi:type II secretory pathway component GspD/PulD (secretin)